MKRTISKSDFIDAFRVVDRLENFSYEARGLLFDYFEELEDDMGEEIKLDAIAVCCDYSEDTVEDIAANYGIDLSECDDDDEKHDTVIDYLADHTSVVGETDSGIVYLKF